MKCFDELQYVMYLDNELGPQEIEQVKTHLDQCNTCNALVQTMEEENRQLKAAFTTGSGADIEARVLAGLGSERQAGRPAAFKRLGQVAAYAASVAVAVFLTLYFIVTGSGTSRVETEAETQIILCNAKVDDRQAESFVFHTDDSQTFIWLDTNNDND